MASEVDRFKNDMARLSERYPDVVLIVRGMDPHVMIARSTDMFWAQGAIRHYGRVLEEKSDSAFLKDDNG